MEVHLVDGTYELFRSYYAKTPPRADSDGMEVGAIYGVLNSIVMMLQQGATHIGVATDHVVESFRNELWDGYKTGEGIDPVLLAQFHPLEDALGALGVTVWPMVEHEADDGLAAAAVRAATDPRVERVLICTPDKDLGQCVGGKVVQFDRRNGVILDHDAVVAKFGVPPDAIVDYLALVGDSADGFPGLPGFGAKTAAALLSHYGSIDAIPDDASAWAVPVRGAARLAETLRTSRGEVEVFRTLARLRTDADVGTVDDWEWRGPRADFAAWCRRLRSERLAEQVARIEGGRP